MASIFFSVDYLPDWAYVNHHGWEFKKTQQTEGGSLLGLNVSGFPNNGHFYIIDKASRQDF